MMERAGAAPSLLIVGCGDLGSAVGEQLAAAGWRVWGMRRSDAALPPGVTPLIGDVTDPASLKRAAALQADYVLVTLTPGRFDDAHYRHSYVDGARSLLARLPQPRRLLWVSSTSVYHQDDGSWVDESSAAAPDSFAGQRLLEAESVLQQSGWPVTVVRLAGIYGPGRDRLLQSLRDGRRSPAAPVRISNRIHRDDAVGILAFMLRRAATGQPLAPLYLGVDLEPAPIDEVERWFADWLRLAPPADAAPGPPLRGGHRYCSSARLQQLGYRFRYPTYREGLPTLVSAAAHGALAGPAD